MYASSATSLLNREELESLVKKSQLKNAQFGVTGCVIYHDGNILQYLEGPKTPVDFIYDSIVLDPRHTGIQRLCYGPVAQRCFSDWRMAFIWLPDIEYACTSLYKLFEDMMEKKQVDKLSIRARVFFETFLHINQLQTDDFIRAS